VPLAFTSWSAGGWRGPWKHQIGPAQDHNPTKSAVQTGLESDLVAVVGQKMQDGCSTGFDSGIPPVFAHPGSLKQWHSGESIMQTRNGRVSRTALLLCCLTPNQHLPLSNTEFNRSFQDESNQTQQSTIITYNMYVSKSINCSTSLTIRHHQTLPVITCPSNMFGS
jgi:hypothetical protein